jgi:hypothetical protein
MWAVKRGLCISPPTRRPWEAVIIESVIATYGAANESADCAEMQWKVLPPGEPTQYGYEHRPLKTLLRCLSRLIVSISELVSDVISKPAHCEARNQRKGGLRQV